MIRGASSPLGFTLIELLVALIVVGGIGATIARLVVGQQRFYASVDERLAMRERLRDGADVVTIALRHAAVQGMATTLAADSAIELATMIGTGTVCGTSGTRIDLTPELPVSGRALTSLAVTPDTTDEVLAYDVGTPSGGARWVRARITGVTTRAASALCAASPVVSVADVASGRVTELSTAPAIAVSAGAPVRIIRRARLDAYRGSDGLVYLGYRICEVGCAGVQPVAGPYGSSLSAISLRYFDVAGTALPTPLLPASIARVTRVDVVLRATSHFAVDLPGRGRGVAHDSVVASIALRNAP